MSGGEGIKKVAPGTHGERDQPSDGVRPLISQRLELTEMAAPNMNLNGPGPRACRGNRSNPADSPIISTDSRFQTVRLQGQPLGMPTSPHRSVAKGPTCDICDGRDRRHGTARLCGQGPAARCAPPLPPPVGLLPPPLWGVPTAVVGAIPCHGVASAGKGNIGLQPLSPALVSIPHHSVLLSTKGKAHTMPHHRERYPAHPYGPHRLADRLALLVLIGRLPASG